jgi:hypothetical protein
MIDPSRVQPCSLLEVETENDETQCRRGITLYMGVGRMRSLEIRVSQHQVRQLDACVLAVLIVDASQLTLGPSPSPSVLMDVIGRWRDVVSRRRWGNFGRLAVASWPWTGHSNTANAKDLSQGARTYIDSLITFSCIALRRRSHLRRYVHVHAYRQLLLFA